MAEDVESIIDDYASRKELLRISERLRTHGCETFSQQLNDLIQSNFRKPSPHELIRDLIIDVLQKSGVVTPTLFIADEILAAAEKRCIYFSFTPELEKGADNDPPL